MKEEDDTCIRAPTRNAFIEIDVELNMGAIKNCAKKGTDVVFDSDSEDTLNSTDEDHEGYELGDDKICYMEHVEDVQQHNRILRLRSR